MTATTTEATTGTTDCAEDLPASRLSLTLEASAGATAIAVAVFYLWPQLHLTGREAGRLALFAAVAYLGWTLLAPPLLAASDAVFHRVFRRWRA